MKHRWTAFLKRLGMKREKPHDTTLQEKGFVMPHRHETDQSLNELRLALYERIRTRSLL